MRNKFLKSLRVLLVEDESKLATLFKNAIGDSFYSFTIANDGEEGLELFKRVAPDIVITDIMMPRKTGLEMAKEIKKLDASMPIIILSAFSETDKFLTAIDVGVVKYFIKPFDPDELLDYIESIESLFGDKTIILKDDFIYNKIKKGLYRKNRYIALTKREKEFLQLVIENYENGDYAVSDEKIKKTLWDDVVSDERLRTFIRRFRKKTSQDLIKNIKREGYRIEMACDKEEI